MKIYVTGAKGQLGRDLMQRLRSLGGGYGFSRAEWDVTDAAQTEALISRDQPNIVIHGAALTHVDHVENDPVEAFRVNAYGTRNVALACGQNGIPMVYLSTDYVFDGEREDGYDEWDTTNPLNVYGRSKEAGEQFVRQFCPKHFIIRTSWLYGVHGNNFAKTLIRKARTEKEIPVVNDQTGSPTFTGHLLDKLLPLIHTQLYGTSHIANSGSCTSFQFARTMVERMGLATMIVPVTSSELSRKATRPRYSALRSLSLPAQNLSLPPHWKDGIDAFINEWDEMKKSDRTGAP